jgi:hypothetical protein
LEFLRPTHHLLTRTLADILTGGEVYQQIDRVVQETGGLAEILIGGKTRYHQKDRSSPVPDTGHSGDQA